MKKHCVILGLFIFSSLVFSNTFTLNSEPKGHLSGPRISPESVKGKVIFLEHWGINCPPCIAMMPHLDQLQKQYGASGKFTVIGSHVQGNGPQVQKYLAQKKFSFPIYQQFRQRGPSFRGIPHAYVYDHTGKLVANGSPHQMVKLIPGLLANVPPPNSLISGLDLKHLKNYQKTMLRDKPIKTQMSALQRMSKKDDAAGKEAKLIYNHVDSWIESELAAIQALSKTKPSEAYLRLASFSKVVYGLPQAEKLRPILAGLKEHKYLNAMVSFQKSFKKLDDNNRNNDYYKNQLKRKLNALLAKEDASAPIKGEAESMLAKL